ncbi:phosphotransferase family protein [Actinoplanes sp. NPDC049599]|uniref:phosphotransferase family protein n=1 Tax=Actinoplanes sp. NPDC049599 TaxID=3363903 RepID=UPI00378E9919
MAHSHHLTFDGPWVTKRYTSWRRGEHRREWAVLRHVHRHAPDLAPRPVTARLDDRPPAVTMARVPGEPLAGPLSEPQLAAVVDAVTRLWKVPHHDVAGLGSWSDDLRVARRLTAAPRPAAGILATASDAAARWWTGPDPALLARRPAVTVLGHRDPNLANYRWDGRRVRVVDFEDAAVSDPATELALMAEHLSWRGAGVDPLGRFDVDPGRLLAARRLWAMFWLGLLLPGGPAAARNPPGTAEAQARRVLDLLGG